MCTVVVRTVAGEPVRLLALRDELTGRPFDDPGYWWPEHPRVAGGRDRTAGGSWCVTDVPHGVTAAVLNRPERRVAAAGAPSRGLLPLLAVEHGADWPDHIETKGMASFTLLLLRSGRSERWDSDGRELTRGSLDGETAMVTSGGAEDGKAARHLAAFAGSDPEDWPKLVQDRPPADDFASLVVRHERDGLVFATVFGQLIISEPGRLELAFSRTPWESGWQTATF